MPLVSVLIPYYNDEKFLEESIKSVLKQTFTDFELILINHACTDSSRNIAHSFNDKRIVHVDLPTNAGAGGGVILEAFLKHARGEYYKLFCADDVLKPNYLEESLNFLNENSDVSFCFSNADYIDEKGKKLESTFYEERTKHIVKAENPSFMALKDYFVGVSNLPFTTVFLRKKCFDFVNIDYTFVMFFDMSVFLQMLLADLKLGFMSDTIASYRIHSGQTSSSANLPKITAMSFFESIEFRKIFLASSNSKLLCKLMEKHKIEPIEKIRLEIAKYWLTYPCVQFQIAGYEYIHNYFQDEKNRCETDFSINNFRAAYANSYLAQCADNYYWVNHLVGIKGATKILLKKIRDKIFKPHKKLTHM